MSIPYEQVGRVRQKRRTREALIEAARSLVASGRTPTVEEAAAEASISRTTAYRYFRNQRELLVAAHPEIQATSLLGAEAPAEVHARLDQVVGEILRFTLEAEPALREMLRLSLDPNPDHREELLLRRGRAVGWLEDALAPLRGRLPDDELRRLVLAIRSAAGIESLVWLTDVAGASRTDAVEIMNWSARSLLHVALCERDSRTKEIAGEDT